MCRRRGWIALAAVAMLAAACSSSGDTSSSTTAGSGDDLAALVVIDTQVDVNDTNGTEGQNLAVGDIVATNPDGFGEVAYFDGSVTRVAQDASFTLTALTDTEGERRVEGTLESGTSWHRVEELTGTDGAYVVNTPVAQATATGTAFTADCTALPDSCTFTAVEGTIELAPTGGDTINLEAPSTITVTADQPPPEPTTLTDTDLTTDTWIQTNLDLDTAQDTDTDTDTGDTGESEGSAGPSTDGTYELTETNAVLGSYPIEMTCSGEVCEITDAAGPSSVLVYSVSDGRVTGTDTTPPSQSCPPAVQEITADLVIDEAGAVTGTLGAPAIDVACPNGDQAGAGQYEDEVTGERVE